MFYKSSPRCNINTVLLKMRQAKMTAATTHFSSAGFLLLPHYTWDPSSEKVYIAHITL